MGALKDKLLQLDAVRAAGGGGHGSILSFTPDIGSAWMPMLTFVVYLAVNWWATWYPGAEPGGGGYIAQRILCAKDEKNSLLATLWFNIAHYAVRPWPWILTALCSLVLYPSLADKESGFIMVIVDPGVFPAALRGLMIAAFAAAYMSTIGTQLNWGASYLVNDFYRRFLVRGRKEKHYVAVSQLATVLIMMVSCVVTYYQESIADAWKLLIAIGAGTGSVLILRWFWWRINAWSEDFRHGRLLFRIDAAADIFQNEQRRSLADHHHGIVLHRDLACGHLYHCSREGGSPAFFLSSRPAQRRLLGTDCPEGCGCARARMTAPAICSIGFAAACSSI